MNITHDTKQLLKNRDLSKITSDICLEKDDNIREFLEENTHLIDYKKLAKNKSNWSFDMCINYINDENNYLINNKKYIIILKMMIKFNNSKFLNNNKLVDKLINFLKNNKTFYAFSFSYSYNKEIYDFILDNIKKINYKQYDDDDDTIYYYDNFSYILKYYDLDTYLELCKLNNNINIIDLNNIYLRFSTTHHFNTILLNENNNIVNYMIKCYEEHLSNKNNYEYFNKLINNFLIIFSSNENNNVVKYLIKNNLINKLKKENEFSNYLLNENDIIVNYIIKNNLVDKNNIDYFKDNTNPIAIEYCKKFKVLQVV